MDGLLLRIFDRLRQTAITGCCDDPSCDLHACLHQMIIGSLLSVRFCLICCCLSGCLKRCSLLPHQLDLPYPEVKTQCMSLLGSEEPFLEGPFLNFALDALLVSLIGTAARDFQLDLSDDTPAIYDYELAVRAGAVWLSGFHHGLWRACCVPGHVRRGIFHTPFPPVDCG
jgi:hypothetical protein